MNYCEGTRLTVQISPNQKPFEVTVISKTETGYYVEICETKTTTCIDSSEIVQLGQKVEKVSGEHKLDFSVKAQIILLGLIPSILFMLSCYYPGFWFISIPYAVMVGSALTLTSFVCIFIIFLVLSIICWLSCYWLTGFNALLGSIGYLVFLLMFLCK